MGHRAGGRQIAQLALPALGVLAAEPLYLLFDIAVVGRLGAISLAGLAIGSLVLGLVGSQATFLSYGTSARGASLRCRQPGGRGHRRCTGDLVGVGSGRVGRRRGGSHRDAAGVGDRFWRWHHRGGLAVAADRDPGHAGDPGLARRQRLAARRAGHRATAAVCGRRLRVVGSAVPAAGLRLAGVAPLGLTGSAVANLVGQWLAALLFAGALLAERVSLRPDRAVLGAQLMMARDLIVRTLAFQVCYVSAAAVAARFGAAALAAHQVVLQLWGLLALVLDSLAIAAQSLVGAALGAGDAGHAKAVAWRVTAFSLLAAGILAAALGLGSSVLPGLFTDDRSVLAAIGVPWWFMVVQLPFAGIVFAVDGVLLGAGDAAFMRTATVASALVGFLPLVWLSLAYGWGLAGIWSGLGTFIVLRLIFVGWRAYSGRWAVTGAA